MGADIEQARGRSHDAEEYVSTQRLSEQWSDLAQGAVEVEQALELNPSSAAACGGRRSESHLEQSTDKARRNAKRYRLNPRRAVYQCFCHEELFFYEANRRSSLDEYMGAASAGKPSYQ